MSFMRFSRGAALRALIILPLAVFLAVAASSYGDMPAIGRTVIVWVIGPLALCCAMVAGWLYKTERVAQGWRDDQRELANELRRIAVATSTATLKTSERVATLQKQLGNMHTELDEQIVATGERAAVERAIAATKQRQADNDEQQTGRLVDVQQTLGAMSVRLLTMASKQEAILATLRSLPSAQADETTLPAQGSEPAATEQPPSGVHASSRFGRALSESHQPRSWPLDNPPSPSSVQPSEPADDSAAEDADLTPSAPKPASDKPPSENVGAWLARRAAARLERAKLTREQEQKRDGEEAEPPSSGSN